MENVRIGQVLFIDAETPQGRFVSFEELFACFASMGISLHEVPMALFTSGVSVRFDPAKKVFRYDRFGLVNLPAISREHPAKEREQLRKWLTN